MNQETFEADNSRVPEPGQLAPVSWNHAAPKCDIDMQLLRGVKFLFQTLNIRRRGNRIQWHVDDRRHAARGRSARRRLETFPIGSSGLVDMNVRIDESGHDH